LIVENSASFPFADIGEGEAPWEVSVAFQAKFSEFYDGTQDTVKWSGAPGYLTGKPLFVSEGFYPEGGSELVNPLGFQFQPANEQGDCFKNERGFEFEILEYPVAYLKYGHNASYSCKARYSFAALRDQGQALDLALFDAFLNNFRKVGKFGKIDLSKRADFVPVFKSGLDDLSS